MRVLHVTSGIDLSNGGPAMAVAGLSSAQQNEGLCCSIAYTWISARGEKVAADLQARRIVVHGLGPCRDPMSRHPDLPDWIGALVAQSDIVHIHALWESIQHYAAQAARRRGIPYLITPHGMLDRWNMSNGWLKKRLYLALRMNRDLSHASTIHFVTEQERQWTIARHLPQQRIVEPFGIDWSEFDRLPVPGSFGLQFPVVADRPYVLFLGRIDRGKGWEFLIPAFAMAAKEPSLRDWLLVLAGPDYFGNLDKARHLARQHGITNRVVFTGMLTAPQRVAALAECQFLALPSCHENFGIVVAEAMAARKSVVVSDQVALHHQVTQWGAGEVTPLDVNRLTAALQRQMMEPQRRTDMGAAGYTMARKCFDWHAIARNWVQHYQTIVRG